MRSNFGLVIVGVLLAVASVTISAYAQASDDEPRPAPARMLNAVTHP